MAQYRHLNWVADSGVADSGAADSGVAEGLNTKLCRAAKKILAFWRILLPSCSESDIPNSGLTNPKDEGTRTVEPLILPVNYWQVNTA
jgi:hypothetical protein